MIKLDSITDIENQFYGNVIDYFLEIYIKVYVTNIIIKKGISMRKWQ